MEKDSTKQYSNGKVVFNYRIKISVSDKVDAKIKEIEDYCEKHRLEKPKKGNFVSELIDKSPVLSMTPEQYIHR